MCVKSSLSSSLMNTKSWLSTSAVSSFHSLEFQINILFKKSITQLLLMGHTVLMTLKISKVILNLNNKTIIRLVIFVKNM